MYHKVVCLDGPVPVQEMMFILENLYQSLFQSYLLVDNSTHIIILAYVYSLSQNFASINDVFDGFIWISILVI